MAARRMKAQAAKHPRVSVETEEYYIVEIKPGRYLYEYVYDQHECWWQETPYLDMAYRFDSPQQALSGYRDYQQDDFDRPHSIRLLLVCTSMLRSKKVPLDEL